jgi:hypothetical protein
VQAAVVEHREPDAGQREFRRVPPRSTIASCFSSQVPNVSLPPCADATPTPAMLSEPSAARATTRSGSSTIRLDSAGDSRSSDIHDSAAVACGTDSAT